MHPPAQSRFDQDGVLDLAVPFHMPTADLAAGYGDNEGQKIYSSGEDLLSRYRGDHCRAEGDAGCVHSYSAC